MSKAGRGNWLSRHPTVLVLSIIALIFSIPSGLIFSYVYNYNGLPRARSFYDKIVEPYKGDQVSYEEIGGTIDWKNAGEIFFVLKGNKLSEIKKTIEASGEKCYVRDLYQNGIVCWNLPNDQVIAVNVNIFRNGSDPKIADARPAASLGSSYYELNSYSYPITTVSITPSLSQTEIDQYGINRSHL